MTFEEYERGTTATWNANGTAAEQVLNALLGLVGEAGELVELQKKQRFHNIAIDHVKELNEIGDILYYLTTYCSFCVYSFPAKAKDNLRKLSSRYPKGFVEGGGRR